VSNSGGLIDVKSEEILEYLNGILDKPVLIKIPLGEKGPSGSDGVGWNEMTYEKTQQPRYKDEIREIVERGGNLGIRLGPCSGNLVTIDLDSDEEMERFFTYAPWARDSLMSVGSKGCQVWFYVDGTYPNKRQVWKNGADRKPTVEFRGALQSVIWGKHPATGGRYTTNGKRPIRISFIDLQEYRDLLQGRGEGTEDDDIWRAGQKGDFEWVKKYKGCDLKQLDLLGMLKRAGIKPKRVDYEEETECYVFECPWIKEHQTENSDRDAAIFMFTPSGKYWPAFQCFHAHCADRGLKDLLEWLEEHRGLGPKEVGKYCRSSSAYRNIVVSEYSDLIKAPPLPDAIIDGLLYPELKMLLASSSKIGKTWMGIDMALSLASGREWMGFDTCQSRVFYLNMEMPEPWFLHRICDVRRAKGIGELPPGSFRGANLRGSQALAGNLDPLYDVWSRNPFDVIIYDPLYKFLGDLDENKATDVAKLLGMIDDFGRNTKVASILIHHYAKGDAWLKKAGDRASGSGVFLRDPDTYMAITSIGDEELGQARVDCKLRCSKPIRSFGTSWGDFQWRRDESIDITPVKKDKEPRGPSKSDLILQILKDNPQGLTNTDWKKLAIVQLQVAIPTFDKSVAKFKDKGLLRQDGKLYFVI
jgi:hypothetical protein